MILTMLLSKYDVTQDFCTLTFQLSICDFKALGKVKSNQIAFFQIKKLHLLMSPGNNIICSRCILETGKLTALLLADISYLQTISQQESRFGLAINYKLQYWTFKLSLVSELKKAKQCDLSFGKIIYLKEIISA